MSRIFSVAIFTLIGLFLSAISPATGGALLPRWEDPDYNDPYYTNRPDMPEGPPIKKPLGKTYFVDDSCYERYPEFDMAIKEVFYMARRACDRTKAAFEGRDDDFARIFKLIMQNDVHDERTFFRAEEYSMVWNDRRKMKSREMVYAVLGSIGWGWQKVDFLNEYYADVRIMCDNSMSWEESPTPDWKWWQPDHQMVNDLICGSQPDGSSSPEGITCTNYWKKDTQAADPNRFRSLITMCNNAFDTPERILDDLYDYGFPKPTEGFPEIDWVVNLFSRVLLHEWVHTRRYEHLDFYLDKGEVGWGYICDPDIEAHERVQDADIFANLGLFAILQDKGDERETRSVPVAPSTEGGWVLTRDWDSLSADEQKRGKLSLLKQYPDLASVPKATERPKIELRSPDEPPYEW